MKKLALLLLACLMLAALPALAEVGLISENPLQFDLPLVSVDDVISLPDGNLLLSATCDDPALPEQWSEYVICIDRTGAVQWSHCLFSHPAHQRPFEIKIALKPEGIVCMKHDQPYHDDLCSEVKWRIGYDGTMLEANTSTLLTADEVPDVTNCGDFCIEMDMEYFDRKDGYPTRIFNRVTGASTAFVHPMMGRCSFLPLGDKLLMFDITYDSPVNARLFDANCQRIAEFSLHVEGNIIWLYDAIETEETLYLFANTANGGQPLRYVVIPVDKATAAVGEPVGVHTYPDPDNTGNGRVLIDGGMLELMGWQPVWESPMHYELRYVTEGSVTPVDEIILRPYDIHGLDQAFFCPAPEGQSATILFREATTGQYVLRTYGASAE